MQQRFLVYLCIQIAVPIISMLIPISLIAYIFGTSNGTRRNLGNIACALVGSHGFVAAQSLIMCNEPYRIFAMGLLMRVWDRKKTQALRGLPEFTRSAQQHAY
nr:7TM GPCR domain containing protein [Haemonchus contortus]